MNKVKGKWHDVLESVDEISKSIISDNLDSSMSFLNMAFIESDSEQSFRQKPPELIRSTNKSESPYSLKLPSSVHSEQIVKNVDVINEDRIGSDSFHRCDTPKHLRKVRSSTVSHNLHRNRALCLLKESEGNLSIAKDIPLKATRLALVWGSVAIGKSDTKEFSIRNMGDTEIRFQVSVESNKDQECFKICRKSFMNSLDVITLKSLEIVTLSVTFMPTSLGAVAGNLIISHYTDKNEKRTESFLPKEMKLCGYGGISRTEISGPSKDTSGKSWLTLNKCIIKDLEQKTVFKGKIKLKNTGNIASFAKLKLVTKGQLCKSECQFVVKPMELVLEAGDIQCIKLEFRPKNEDYIKLLKQVGVIQVGTLRITYGDEPTRLRIRGLYSKLKKVKHNRDELEDYFKDIIPPICKTIAGETSISDLSKLETYHAGNIGDLCQEIFKCDIRLTVEIDTDDVSNETIR